MVILRYALIALSSLCALSLLMVWVFSSNSAGIGNIIPLALVLANLFYLVLSRPLIRASDFLVKTSERFASASIELQYLAQEARSREIEAEKRRLVEAELHQHKLRAAREMLQYFRPKLSLKPLREAKPQRITSRADAAKQAPSTLSPPPAADTAPPPNGHSLTPNPVSPTGPAPIVRPKVTASAAVLN